MPDTQLAGRAAKKRRTRALNVGREFRRFTTHGLEVRSATAGSNDIVISGVPIAYNTGYEVFDMLGSFEETMHPGVAATVLASGTDTRFLFNHEGLPLARSTSGTLTFNDTMTGLGIEARMDSRQQLANDLAVAIERGDVSQMSCGFRVGVDSWSDDWTKRDIYQIEELFDVSAVTYPASPTTTVELALRSMMSQPVESRARVRKLWAVTKDFRAGATKTLTTESAGMLAQALEALHEADDVDIPGMVESLQTIDSALDAGQGALAGALGVDDPDGDPADLDPALVSPDETDTAGDSTGGDGRPADEEVDSRSITLRLGELRLQAPPETPAERRAAQATFGDIESALDSALQLRFPASADGDCWSDLWVRDATDNWVVFTVYGDGQPGPGMWQLNYSMDDDMNITFDGEPFQVAVETNYVPVTRSTRSSLIALELEAEQLRLRGQRRHAA